MEYLTQNSKKRKTGIEVLGKVPWGTHFCLFYENKDDLLDILIPYFKAGLENNEYCMWIISEPLTKKEAEAAAEKGISNFKKYVKKKQIEIIPYDEWYLKDNVFDLQRVLNDWVEELNYALDRGYDGIRVTGNTAWLEKADWKSFTDYEEEINKIIPNYEMIASCTYSLNKCGPYEVLDVIHNHQFALIRREGNWLNFKSMEQIKAEEKVIDIMQKLKKSEEKYRIIAENANDLIFILDSKSKFLYCNETFEKIVGYTPQELLGTSAFDYAHPEDINLVINDFKNALNVGSGENEARFRNKNGTYLWLESKGTVIYDSQGNPERISLVTRNITDRKQSEKKISDLAKFPSENPNPVLRVDKERIIYSNKAGVDIFNICEGNDIPENLQDAIKEAFSTNKNKIVELRLNAKMYSFVVTPVERERYVNIYGLEITEIKKAKDRLIESEKQYKYIAKELEMILDHIPGIIVYKDTENNILRVNKFLADAHNLLKEEMEGKSCFDLYPKEQAQAYWEDDLEVIKSGKLKLNIVEPWEPEKGKRWVNTSKIPYIDEGGNVKGIIAIASDITEMKLAEEKLKESEEKFRTIAEQSLMGIAILQDDVFKYENQQFAEIFGYEVDEMLSWQPTEYYKLTHPDDLNKTREQARKKQLGELDIINQYQFRGIKKTGEIIWIEILSKTAPYDGNPADFITILNITEKKKAEQELMKLSKLKSELLTRTFHELKTPLISIKGNADLLLEIHRDKLDSDTISIIEEIYEGCERLEDLIIDLLESSKLESGKIKLNLAYEDLAFLIRFCVKELRWLVKSRNHRIILELHDALVTMFEKERMYQVINNLLSNAVKYTPSNGFIKIKSEIKENFVVISIQDNGIGFTEEEKEQIFKQFGKIERYGKGWDIGIEGTGMGLYISKKIIELHGGKIWVESEGKNKGSTINFSLPIITN